MSEPEPVAEGRRRAGALRYDLKLGDAPVRDLFGFIERHFNGVLVVRYPMPDGPEGALLHHRDRWLIVVNSAGAYLPRQRFTAAHELGHLLFDADREPLHIDKHIFDGGDPTEMRANAFAVHFLMPADALRARINDPGFDVSNEYDVVNLAMEYGLSLQSLAWHLKNICGISERQRRAISDIKVFKVSARMGLADRVAREFEAKDSIGWPNRYTSLVTRAYERGMLTDTELREALRDDRLADRVKEALSEV